jgi:predicted ATPase
MLSSNLPSGLVALLQTRLDELPSTTRQVIQAASVIGPTFWPGAIIQLVGSGEMVERALEDLENRGIIQPKSESDFDREREYRFRHTLHRDVVYSMLARQNREAYHHNIAAWLAERVANRPEYLGILAEHYQHSQLHTEALKAYVNAARERFQRGLMGETLNLIEKGLDVARKVSRDRALPQVSLLWMIQGQVYDALDRYEESSAASETALMLLNEQPEEKVEEQKAIASRTLGTAYVSLGRYEDAFNMLNRANSLISEDNKSQQAAILRSFGTLFRERGQLNESLAYQQQAFQMAQRSDNPREMARIMAALSKISLDRGDFHTALNYCEIVLEMNLEDDNIYFQILDLRQMATIHRLLFNYDRVLELCDLAEPLQARIRYQDTQLHMNRALCIVANGDPKSGIRLLQQATATNSENAMTQNTLQLALMNGLALTGDYEACYEVSTTFVNRIGDKNLMLLGRGLLWQGIAQNALQDHAAKFTLGQALKYELEFGGRDAWLCYYALGKAAREFSVAEKYYQLATDVLHAIASTLYTRPDLQRKLRNDHVMRWLDNESDPADTIILPLDKPQPSSN